MTLHRSIVSCIVKLKSGMQQDVESLKDTADCPFRGCQMVASLMTTGVKIGVNVGFLLAEVWPVVRTRYVFGQRPLSGAYSGDFCSSWINKSGRKHCSEAHPVSLALIFPQQVKHYQNIRCASIPPSLLGHHVKLLLVSLVKLEWHVDKPSMEYTE